MSKLQTRRLMTACFIALAACSGTQIARAQNAEPKPEPPSTSTVAPEFTYYQIRSDVRRCAAPLCGGFFVKKVNASRTRCADGALRKECYVAEVDLAGLTIGSDPGDALRTRAPQFLLRGTLDPVRFEVGELGVFRTREAWLGHEGATARGTFFRGRNNGLVCITTPCLSFTVQKLNSSAAPEDVAGIDLEGIMEDPSDGFEQLNAPEGLLLAAQRTTVSGPAGTATALDASEYYVPFKAESEAQLCGSRGLPGCPQGQFCAFPPEADCGRADAPGVCTRRPEVCIQIFDPVCGCDGRTYSNACQANSEGVSVDPRGDCDLGPSSSPPF